PSRRCRRIAPLNAREQLRLLEPVIESTDAGKHDRLVVLLARIDGGEDALPSLRIALDANTRDDAPIADAHRVLHECRCGVRAILLVARLRAAILLGQQLADLAFGTAIEEAMMLVAHAPLERMLPAKGLHAGERHASVDSVGAIVAAGAVPPGRAAGPDRAP